MPDSNAAAARGPIGTTRGEPDNGEAEKEDILAMVIESETALPQVGQQMWSVALLGGAEFADLTRGVVGGYAQLKTLALSKLLGMPSRDMVIGVEVLLGAGFALGVRSSSDD
jgi:hypothetical protein